MKALRSEEKCYAGRHYDIVLLYSTEKIPLRWEISGFSDEIIDSILISY